MTVKLSTEHHLEFLNIKEGCTGSSESTHVKISNCWKSHVAAHMILWREQCLVQILRMVQDACTHVCLRTLKDKVSTVLCKWSTYTRGSGWGIMISE